MVRKVKHIKIPKCALEYWDRARSLVAWHHLVREDLHNLSIKLIEILNRIKEKPLYLIDRKHILTHHSLHCRLLKVAQNFVSITKFYSDWTGFLDIGGSNMITWVTELQKSIRRQEILYLFTLLTISELTLSTKLTCIGGTKLNILVCFQNEDTLSPSTSDRVQVDTPHIYAKFTQAYAHTEQDCLVAPKKKFWTRMHSTIDFQPGWLGKYWSKASYAITTLRKKELGLDHFVNDYQPLLAHHHFWSPPWSAF